MFKAIKEFFFGKPAPVAETAPDAPYKVETPILIVEPGLTVRVNETPAPAAKVEPTKKAPAKRKPTTNKPVAKKPAAPKKPAARKSKASN